MRLAVYGTCSEARVAAGGPISLEQLAALNDEIAALVRAGIPLERGLGLLGAELPGSLGAVAQSLALRMQRGESLPAALAASSGQLPAGYAALVEAGLSSGRLTSAVELMAESLRRVDDLRRVALGASIYLLIVVVLAIGCTVGMLLGALPHILRIVESRSAPVTRFLASHGPTLAALVVAVGAAVLAAMIVWFVRSGRARAVGSWQLGAMPGFRSLWRATQLAQFCEMLSLLVQNEVPLHRAVRLAAAALGDGRTTAAAVEVSAAMERGERVDMHSAQRAGFPPFVAWLLSVGGSPASLARMLRQSAESQRARAIASAEWTRQWLPLVIVGGLGGLIVAAYVGSLFVPYVEMLRILSFPKL